MVRVMLPQIGAEMLNLFGSPVGVPRHHGLISIFAKMLTGLTQRLSNIPHGLGHEIFAHVESRRGLLYRLFHEGGRSPRSSRARIRTSNLAGGFLNRINDLARHCLRPISHARCCLWSLAP